MECVLRLHFFVVRLTIVNYLKAEGNLRPMRDMVTYSHLKRKVRQELANKVSAEVAEDNGKFDREL